MQKCPVIINLSVLIFINNRARHDPAGMLMSPQSELISCGRHSGPPRPPPSPLQWSSGRLSNVHSSAGRFVIGRPVEDETRLLYEFPPPGFHERKVLPRQKVVFPLFYFSVRVYVLFSSQSLHLIRRAFSSSDRPPRGSRIQRNSTANGSWRALCSF